MFSVQQSDIPKHVKIYLLCKTWRININILPPQPLTGATCLPHYTHFTCIQPLNRKRCRYLDIYLCTHYTHTRVFIIICPIHCYQYEWKPGRRTEDCWMRIIIIMITMTPGSGERCGRIKQWIIMELTYGIWAAAAPWIQRGSVAHTVTPCTRPAPHHTNPCPLIEYGAVRR